MDKKINAMIIMDGFGVSDSAYGNAIKKAATPNLDKLFAENPNTTIGASGMDVGLPDGQMGNSEVGHLNIGAGRIVYQELTRITKAIQDGDFFENAELLAAMRYAKQNGKKLHTFGLLSDGGVHSHIEHLFALIELAKKCGLDNIFVHCFLDGRDVPPRSGADFIKQLKDFMQQQSFGEIATVMGRYYAMDRDNRWERVEKAFDAMTMGIGEECADAEEVVRQSYKKDITDEFVVPAVVKKEGIFAGRIEQGDSIVFFNFRPDRAREISRAFIEPEFKGFERKSGYLSPLYTGMTQYDASFVNIATAFKPQSLANTLGEVLAAHNLTQLRIAETEKYAHVTFFFNGGVEVPNKGEDRVLIPSPKVATYDLKPSMSAIETAKKAAELIRSKKYDVMILNFANCDMVGHTGVFSAAVEAVETVDKAVGIVMQAICEQNGNAIITADHGNADKMYEADGSPFTAHTTNPVPFILVSDKKCTLRKGAVLADAAPTLLHIMGIPQPKEMTGKSIIT
jgi:2,3-bisphosphoglycerate-independent phosphoglycerate mutase